jgi:hypothetical protein
MLSHTLGENEEVAFEELGTLIPREKRRLPNIERSGRQAATNRYDFVKANTYCTYYTS